MSWMDYSAQDWCSFKGVLQEEPMYDDDHFNMLRDNAKPMKTYKRAREGEFQPRKSKKAKEITDDAEWEGLTAAPAVPAEEAFELPVKNAFAALETEDGPSEEEIAEREAAEKAAAEAAAAEAMAAERAAAKAAKAAAAEEAKAAKAAAAAEKKKAAAEKAAATKAAKAAEAKAAKEAKEAEAKAAEAKVAKAAKPAKATKAAPKAKVAKEAPAEAKENATQAPATPVARRTRGSGRNMFAQAFDNVVEAVVNSPLFKAAEKAPAAEIKPVRAVRSSRLRAMTAA